MAVAGAGEGAQGHAMETVGEGDDAVAPGHLAGQLQRGLDGVGAGRAGELKAIVEAARLQDDILESRDEGGLGLGIHVEAVRDAVARSEEHTSALQSLMRISYAVF